MKRRIINRNNGTEIFYTTFSPDSGEDEYQVVIQINKGKLSFEGQVEAIRSSLQWLILRKLRNTTCVFKRYFLSDISNQANRLLAMETDHCAISIVGQPPLNRTRVALLAYLQTGMKTKVMPCGLYAAEHNGYRHLRSANNYKEGAGSEVQTRLLLTSYIKQLNELGCTLADNCIRTWFYVQDVDNNYAGMVKARNDVFLTHELTSKTHFITSTGIEGKGEKIHTLVSMDNYAIDGISDAQIRFLHALTHLSPTSIYGVSFERGIEVTYGDRRHIFLSGTASIDDKGKVVGVGQICQQTLRMWENVEALLAEANATLNDIASIIVYLRDISDYPVVKRMFNTKFQNLPVVIVQASVCRPSWLIEMECMAIVSDNKPEFKPL